MFDDAIRQANEHKAITSLRFLADLARSLGFENRKQESNAELIGRALRTLAEARDACGSDSDFELVKYVDKYL